MHVYITLRALSRDGEKKKAKRRQLKTRDQRGSQFVEEIVKT